MTPLPKSAKVVVIGGGIAGCSTAYHLAKNGWKDTVLIERDKLTSGTTWHAAGMITQLGPTAQITKLRKHSISFYKKLIKITGQNSSFKKTGTINIASNKVRYQEYLRQKSMSKLFDIDIELIDKKRFKNLYPIAKNQDIVGGLYIPGDGQADPEVLSKTIAKAAQKEGAQIIENCSLKKILTRNNQIRGVSTNLGKIEAEYVVLCSGMWSRQIGEAAGVSIPLYPNEHFYMITEKLKNLPKILPTFRDPNNYLYLREYNQSLLIGIFEPNAKNAFKKTNKVPEDFSFGEFKVNQNYVRTLQKLAAKRIPSIKKTKIDKYFSGPESFTPDTNYLLGETSEIKKLFVCCGFNSIGIGSAGGAGKATAEWMMNGHMNEDLFALDIKRFENFNSSLKFIKKRVTESLGNLFNMHWPYKQLTTSRNVKILPYHSELKKAKACFGSVAGYERPMWYAINKEKPNYKYSYGFQNWFYSAKKETISTRKNLGLYELTPFAKFEVKGNFAHRELQRLCANNIKNIPGKTTYTQMLNVSGGIECDITVACLKDNYFRIISPAMCRVRDKTHILRNIKNDINFSDVTENYACLGIFGPQSRIFMTEFLGDHFSNELFPFATGKNFFLNDTKLWLQRLSFIGELGWEIYIPIKNARKIFNQITKLGKKYSLCIAGMHALDILRLEKKFLHWGHDITNENNPFEAGLKFAVNLKKKCNFIGRKFLESIIEKPLEKKLHLFSLIDSKPGKPLLLHDEPIFYKNKLVGNSTSSNYSFFYKKNIFLAYVSTNADLNHRSMSIEIEGVKYRIKFEPTALHDPKNILLRS